MSKGLEELEKIELKWQYGVFTFIPNFEIIEKELKVLEIIKKRCAPLLKSYMLDQLPKEEYNLIKEWLEI